MIKGFTVQKQHHHHHNQVSDQDNMSNLTSASGDQAASVSSSGNRPDQNPLLNYTFPPPTNQPQQSSSLKRKRNLPGNPDPEAEVISLSPKTLMERNRFICEICSKGFARDQNLQLHRRGHNLPWKLKQRNSKDVIRKKVYVCPETTCVHHDPSRALGDLTGIKKHFSRKHGEKKWKCDKCSKMYAVQSDWKAHSKTCGTREYRCDCGTLFSRRDSFITHRAFCDALAEESSRAITEGTSHHHHQLPLPPNSTTSSPLSHMSSNNMNHDLTFQTHNFNNSSTNDGQQQHLNHPMFTTKKEQQNIPPWLSQLEHHHHSLFTTNSNSNQQEQDFRNVGPTPPAAAAAAYMSATALLQKAAQMGSTMSKNNCSSSSSSAPLNNNNTAGFGLNLSSCEKIIASSTAADTSTTVDRVTFGLTDHSVPPLPATPEAFFHDMMMNSLSSHSPGFDPSNAFEDAFSFGQGNNNTTSTNNHNHHHHPDQSGAAAAGGGGTNDDGLTRDFFGFSK